MEHIRESVDRVMRQLVRLEPHLGSDYRRHVEDRFRRVGLLPDEREVVERERGGEGFEVRPVFRVEG